MIYLTSTRFNNSTWEQNCLFREKGKIEGCIYGVPRRIPEKIILNSEVIVIEMNNDINKIMGLGVIRNYLRMDKHYKIYQDGNYNRFTYKSELRVDRDEFSNNEILFIEILENLLFYGSTHVKRGQGITQLPDMLLGKNKKKIIKKICKIFVRRFKSTNKKN